MMQRDLYPENWPHIRKAALERANGRCEACRARHGRTHRISPRSGNHSITYLAVTHPDHDPWNPLARLRVLCQACHQRQDQLHHQQNAARTRELHKRGMKHRHGSISYLELLGIARRLGITIEHRIDAEGDAPTWTWHSEMSTGTSCDLAHTLEQALYDMLATYREQGGHRV
jgi:hypothetical protein